MGNKSIATQLQRLADVNTNARQRRADLDDPSVAALHRSGVCSKGCPYHASDEEIAEGLLEYLRCGLEAGSQAIRKALAMAREDELARALPNADANEALSFLLTRIGSWTSARWDQHLRHEFGDDRAERAMRWIRRMVDVQEYGERRVSEGVGRNWETEVREIAHALAVEYEPSMGPRIPGELRNLLDEIDRLKAAASRLGDMQALAEQQNAYINNARLEVLASKAGGHDVGAPATREEQRAMARELIGYRMGREPASDAPRPGSPEHVEFWDAIHAYARASYTGEEGGPSGPRMAAAARVEEAARKWPGTSQSRFCAYEDCDQEPSALCVAHAEADSIAAVVAWLRAEAEDPRTAHAGGVDALHDAADDIESGAWRKGATHRKEASTVREIAASLLDAAEAHATGAKGEATNTVERAVLDIVALARSSTP